MALEEYAKLIGVFTFVNANQAIMNIRLNSGIIEDALRDRVSVCGVSRAACWDFHLVGLIAFGRVEAGLYV